MSLYCLKSVVNSGLRILYTSCSKYGGLERTYTAAVCSHLYSTQSTKKDASTRYSSVNTEEHGDSKVAEHFINRNPRNLEMMGIARKKSGWKFQYPTKEYYHRLLFDQSHRYISGRVEHSSGETVVSASSKELAIARHLYSAKDVSAAANIGRILAQRCCESGITCTFVQPPESGSTSSKFLAFKTAIEEGGVTLEEPEVIRPEYTPGIDYDNQEEVQNLLERQKRVADLGEKSAMVVRMQRIARGRKPTCNKIASKVSAQKMSKKKRRILQPLRMIY